MTAQHKTQLRIPFSFECVSFIINTLYVYLQAMEDNNGMNILDQSVIKKGRPTFTVLAQYYTHTHAHTQTHPIWNSASNCVIDT